MKTVELKKSIAYEIHDLTTNEVLADNLKFKEVPELYAAYQKLYPDDNITVATREFSCKVSMSTRASLFKDSYIDFMEELYLMGNIEA